MLKSIFFEIANKYTQNKNLIYNLWLNIQKRYSDKSRFYHNLSHLENMFSEIDIIKSKIVDIDCVALAIFYHDIIYNPLKTDNEKQSAEFMNKQLSIIEFPKIENCKNHIFATQKHELSQNSDTNFLNDIDIAVFGQEWDIYEKYMKNIRQEYYMFTNTLFNSGRKKVLSAFLANNQIYKTDFFINKYEKNARKNILSEIELLSNYL